MASRIQTLRSSVTGNRPSTASAPAGSLYVNFPDRMIGVMDAGLNPIDLVGVPFFSATANYAINAVVVHQGQILRALGPVTASAFDATEWARLDSQPVTVSNTAPVSPLADQIWIDTSGVEPIFKFWDGTEWVAIAERAQGVIVPAFDAGSTYQRGDFVFHLGAVWVAEAAGFGPSAFNAANWVQIRDDFLPLAGGTLTGPADFSHSSNLATRKGTVQRYASQMTMQYTDISSGTVVLSGLALTENDIAASGTAVAAEPPSSNSLMTRFRGDARYLKLDGTGEITGDLNFKSLYPWEMTWKNAADVITAGLEWSAAGLMTHNYNNATGALLSTLHHEDTDLRFTTQVAAAVPVATSLLTRARGDARYARNPLGAELYDVAGEGTIEITVTSIAIEDTNLIIRQMQFGGTIIPDQTITILDGTTLNNTATAISVALNNLVAGSITLNSVAVGPKVSIVAAGGQLSGGTTQIDAERVAVDFLPLTGGTLSGPLTVNANMNLAGVTNKSTVRGDLGLGIGTNVQAWDAGLQSIAGLTPGANQMIYTTGSNVYAVANLSAAGRALIDDANAAAQRTTMGVAIGTNVQGWDAGLQSIANLTPIANQMLYATGSNVYATTALTAAGRALLDDTDNAAQRLTLGLAAAATKNVTGIDALVVSGTAGANNELTAWDANGDLISAGASGFVPIKTSGTERARFLTEGLSIGAINARSGSILTLVGTMSGSETVAANTGPAGIFLEDENVNQAFITMPDNGNLQLGVKGFGKEIQVRDGAGNLTTISPHDFSGIPEGPSEPMAWSYHSERDGKTISVDMLRVIRVLEDLSGEQLVYET